MKVEHVKIKVSVLLVAVLACGLLGLYLLNGSGDEGSSVLLDAGKTFLLVNPVFARSVSSDTSFLDDEAGISIYVDVGRSIDLAVAETVYRTLEKETSNYTVGSVPLPGLPESEDVHCFVHKDGWIVAYYLQAEPVGKIVDWSYWTDGKLTKNKLQVGLEQMSNALGATVTGAKYYHFQHPYANQCMLVVDTLLGTNEYREDSFNITIPLEFTVYERSWSHYSEYANPGYPLPSYFKINGDTVDTISSSSPLTKYGQLSVSQLSSTFTHIVSVSGYYNGRLYGVSIALVYQEP